MLHERLEANNRPFDFLNYPGYQRNAEDVGKRLGVIGLTSESTADEVRRVAISIRVKMRESGLNVESVKVLKWALEETYDCQDEKEFLKFLLNDYTFEEVERYRKL